MGVHLLLAEVALSTGDSIIGCYTVAHVPACHSGAHLVDIAGELMTGGDGIASQLVTGCMMTAVCAFADAGCHDLDDNLILAAHRHRYIPDTAHGRAVVDQRSHGFHRLSSFKRFEWVLPLLETDESWLLPRRVHTERRRGTWHRYCVAPLQTPVRT